jgi:hypothetical protein
MADGIVVVLVGIASLVTLVAFFLVLGLLFQSLVRRTRDAGNEMPGRSFVIGFVNTLFVSILALGFNALGDGTGLEFLKLPALLLVVVFAIFLAFGLTGMAWIIGERLVSDRDRPAQLLFGGIAMALACLTPYIGWFLLTPYLCFRGLGGVLLGITRGQGEQSIQPVEESQDL